MKVPAEITPTCHSERSLQSEESRCYSNEIPRHYVPRNDHRVLTWAFSAVCGLAWGLGLARTLALELHSGFFFDVTGTVICAVLCANLVLLLVTLLRDHRPPWQVAPRLIPLLLPLVDVFGGAFRPWRGPVLLAGSLALAVLLVTGVKLTRRAGFVLAVAIPLAVYLPDISPYVGRADTFEFQVVAPRLGIAHPSGYPLYILLGKLFSLLPFGSGAWRINLSSAVCSALASGMLFLTLSELRVKNCELGISDRRSSRFTLHASRFTSPALLVALTLAFSPTLWARSIEAEVYALNALLAATALWLAVRWTSGRLSTKTALPLLGLLTGVAMASHVTLGALFLLALPLMLTARPRPTWRTLLTGAGLGLAGLGLYLYIPLRWPAVNDGAWMSAAHFLRFVTNAESGGALHPLAFVNDPARWSLVLRLLQMQAGWVGLALAAWGLLWLFRRQWPLALGSLLAFGAWVWFNLSFYVADPDYSAFLVPGHVMLFFWIGAGIANCELRVKSCELRVKRYASRFTPYVLRFTFYVLTTALALLPTSRLWITGPTLDTMTTGREDEAWARYALQQPLADGAAILADSEKFPPLYYMQQVEGIRPDLELVTLFNEAQYREALETRLAAGQHVYLARYLPGADAFGVRSVGPLVEVGPPSSVPELAQPPHAKINEALELNAVHIDDSAAKESLYRITLVWHVTQPITEDLTVRFGLDCCKSNEFAKKIVWESQPVRPVGGYSSTLAWQPGDIITDYYAVEWPAWLPTGIYYLNVGVFPRFAEQGEWAGLGRVAVYLENARTHNMPRRNVYFDGTGLWLEGADMPETTWAGGQLAFDVAWYAWTQHVRTRPVAQWTAVDGTSRLPANTQPMEQIDGREVSRYTIQTPDAVGKYRLEIGRGTENGPVRARCGYLQPVTDFCTIGTVDVGPSNAGLANFDNRTLLLKATVDAGDAAAGGQMHVSLRWRGLQTLDKDYTVFVQVIGPDGQLYGQVDSWPVQGARPTSGWQPGEEIDDAYSFFLKEDAPSGAYQVIVGWYLLADMRRLPVVNETGQAIGDFHVAGEFTLP